MIKTKRHIIEFLPIKGKKPRKEKVIVKINKHHPNSRDVKNAVKYRCGHLIKCLDWDFTIFVPVAVHEAYNGSFSGNFLHTQVLRQLDNMLEKNICYSDEDNGYIIEFLFYCSVYKNREKESSISLKYSVLEKYYELPVSEISFLELLDFFQISKKDIIIFLEKFFFHPDYKKYSDNLMKELEECHAGYIRDGRKKRKGVKIKKKGRRMKEERKRNRRKQAYQSIAREEWKEKDGSILSILEKGNVAFLERITENGSSSVRFKKNGY